MDEANPAETLALLESRRDRHVVADCDGHDVMVVMVAGALPVHVHEVADDFLVIDGRIEIDRREASATHGMALGPRALLVVPAGAPRHRLRAEAEVQRPLVERRRLPSTGDPATAAPQAAHPGVIVRSPNARRLAVAAFGPGRSA